MSKLIEWIKANAKEGANLAEAEELVSKGTFDGITTKEQAMDFIGKNAAFQSAADSMISTAVNRHDEKFTADKLPGILEAERERVVLEMKPNETPEQKEIRELKDWKFKSEQKELDYSLKAQLRTKAGELGYDPALAEAMSVYGDQAFNRLETVATYTKSLVDSTRETLIKETLGGKPPQGGETSSKISREDIAKLGSREERTQAMKENGYL